MSPPSSSFQVSEASFDHQIRATREALNIFLAISALNAPGPGKVAMAELINITVRPSFIFESSQLT